MAPSKCGKAGGVNSTPTLISFTIDGTSYQAEEGMTWEEWIKSSYNVDGFIIHGTTIEKSTTVAYNGAWVHTTDIIISGATYVYDYAHGH